MPNNFKKFFPWFSENPNKINFDNAATSLKIAAIDKKIASNLFSYKKCKKSIYKKAQKIYGNFFNVQSKNIYFSQGATTTFHFLAEWIKKVIPKGEIVLNYHEHSANLLPWINLEINYGFKINWLDPKEDLTEANLIKLVNKQTKILAFANATNLSGKFLDANYIAKKVKEINPECLVIVDAVQYLQHKTIDLNQTAIDFLCGAAHKMYGTFGTGFLFINDNLLNQKTIKKDLIDLIPVDYASLDVAAYCLDFLNKKIGFDLIQEKEKKLIEYFKTKFPYSSDFKIVNQEANSTIFLIKHKNIPGEDLAYYLAQKNIYVRPGFSCAKLMKEVFNDCNFVRVSLAFYNEIEEIDAFFEILKNFKSEDALFFV